MEDTIIKPENTKQPEKKTGNPSWKNWREALPPAVVREASQTFAQTLDLAGAYRSEMKDQISDPNRLAVVVSAYDAKSILPETIRDLVGQMREANVYGEIFVVLNNGGGDTASVIPTPETETQTKANWRVDSIVRGKVKETDSIPQTDRGIPKPIELQSDIPNDKGISVVFIDQEKRPDNEGKSLALRDIYSFLHKEHTENGYNAGRLLAIDAETRLRMFDERSQSVDAASPRALKQLLDRQIGHSLIGAKNALTPYTADGNPDWKQKPPPMQAAINVLHGHRGFDWLPGGATLGRFDDLVPMMEALTQKMPGVRVEDVTTTVMAKALSLPVAVTPDIVHANRCPQYNFLNRDEERAQMERWLKGAEGTRLIAGRSLTEQVVTDNLAEVIGRPISEFLKGKRINLTYLTTAIPSNLRRTHEARKRPDNPISGNASWNR